MIIYVVAQAMFQLHQQKQGIIENSCLENGPD